MKLIIQILCWNEEKTLPITLNELPREVEGFDEVEWLMVDDGSTDNSVKVAKELGVEHIVRLGYHQGISKAFIVGIESSLRNGADVIVTTDADNQYFAGDIPKLVEPILKNKADIAIGTRPIKQIEHFSPLKKFLQQFGSWIVRKISNTDIQDVTSGFKAISRKAALKLNIFCEYSYCVEMAMQIGLKDISVCNVPIRVNKDLRPSRLIKSQFYFVFNAVITIFRTFITYKPVIIFGIIGFLFFLSGIISGIFLFHCYMANQGCNHIGLIVLTVILLALGVQTILIGLLTDLIRVNRNLSESLQLKFRDRYEK